MRRTGLATTFIMTVCGVLVTLIAVATTHAASLRPVSFAKGSSVSPWLPHETTLSVAAPQIRVTHPLPGDTLSADSTVRVESNLPPEALIEVEFYLQPEAQQPDGDEALLFLGLDRDGDDGWSVPLPLSDLHPSRRYRVLALAVDGQENILRALGGWFSVHPSPAGNTWAYSPLPDPVRGESSLSIVAPSGEISPMRMDLYLAPVIGEPEATRPPFDAPPPLHYLGSGLLEDLSDGGRALTTFPYDSRLLPDGLYAPVVELVGNDGERYPAPPAAPFRIENALAPDVTLTGPGHAVTDEISLSVDIDDPTGNIERVDFYLEYSQPVLELDEGKRESMPHIFWLGSDIDGSDGWGLRVSSEEFWDGDHWHVLAVAYNSAGMSGSARSPRFSIVHNPRVVLRLLSPSPDRPLRGVERVVLQAAHGAQHVHSVHLFARNDGGALIDLGEMPPSVNQWRMDWDTRSLPDGEYSLVALVSHESGQSLAESRPLLLQNQRDLYHFSALPDDGPLTGTTPIRISPAPGAPDIVEATIYYRDAGGEMYLLPQQPEAETEWETLWDTATALDGEYDLVAHITHSEGEVATAIRPVTIHNATPVITLEPLDTQTPWSREREITWHTEHPLDLPVQVTIEYSPDGGYRWDTVAEGLPAEGSYLWDTRRFADSAAGRLRLTADDGIRCGRTISPSFVVNNLNQPPHLAILSPEAGYSTPDQVQVTWQTWSPTGSPLTIDLTYRQNEGERWRWLARRIADTGHYVWDISDLPANETYTLRVTARDAQGYTTSCTVEGISRLSRTLPHVELLWPNSRIRIDRETVILWEATGEDDERLLIDLYYSENAGQAWLPLAEGLPNTGYYVWQVAFLPPSTQYRIRVVARDGPFRAYDDSDAAFILGQIPRPQVSLLAPRASAHLSGTQIVRWSTFVHDGTPLLASVAVRRATGGDWQILAEGIKNTDFYLWDTTPFDDGQYHLRVTLSDPENATRVEVTETIYLFNQRRQPPVVSLISPQGGEEWAGLHEIIWTARSAAETLSATIAISADTGNTWTDLATVDGRAGRYVWDTTAMTEPQYLVRVTVTDGQDTVEDVTTAPVTLIGRNRPPRARIISPDMPDAAGQRRLIAWIAEDPDDRPLDLTLALSADNGLTWTPLLRNLDVMGEHRLDAPLEPGQQYRLSVQVDDGLYTVRTISSSFTRSEDDETLPILELPELRLGEEWSRMTILRWHAQDPQRGDLRIGLHGSTDGGRTWQVLEQNLENTGAYIWDTTTVPNGTYLLRITATGENGSRSGLIGPVMIRNTGREAPTVSLLSPRGGEIWSGMREITWRTAGGAGPLVVNLFYSMDQGASWRTLARSLPDTGRYIWDTTTIPNADDIWVRITVSDGQFRAQSVSTGPITIRNPFAPVIRLLAPQAGSSWMGPQTIMWQATQRAGRTTRVNIEVSLDMGHTWQTLSRDLPAQGSYVWDTGSLPDGSRALIRVTATDDLDRGVDTLREPLRIHNSAPRSIPSDRELTETDPSPVPD